MSRNLSLRIVVVGMLVWLTGCSPSPPAAGDGGTDGSSSNPSCALDCTAFPSNGDCYCQTTCRGVLQIFTCLANTGNCACQGSGANPNRVSATCASMSDAQAIYAQCFP